MPPEVQTVRAKPEHRDIFEKIASLLKQHDAEIALRRLLDDPSARPIGPFRDQVAAVAFIRD